MVKQHKKVGKTKFAHNFNLFLKKTRLKKNRLAELVDVTPPTITNWSQGKRIPKMSKLNKLANIFNTNVKTLLGTEDDHELTEEEELEWQDKAFDMLKDDIALDNQQAERNLVFEYQHPQIQEEEYLRDDMAPTIPEFANLLIDKNCKVKDGDLIYVGAYRGNKNGVIPKLVRRVYFDNGSWILVNDNLKKPDKFITADLNNFKEYSKVNDNLSVSLIGVVVGYHIKFYS